MNNLIEIQKSFCTIYLLDFRLNIFLYLNVNINFPFFFNWLTHSVWIYTSPFLCKHLFMFLTKHWNLYASPVFGLNDVVTFVVSVLQLWNSTWCWYSRFLSPCPSSLMTTTVEKKKRSRWNRTICIEVCQPSLFSHPSWLCLLCIAAKHLPPEMDIGVWPADSDSKVRPEPEVPERTEAENERAKSFEFCLRAS